MNNENSGVSIFGLLVVIALFSIVFGSIYKMFNSGSDSVVIDNELRPYVLQWKANMNHHHIDYQAGFNRIESITFGDTDDNAGLHSSFTRTIKINPALKGNPMALRFTVWHEFGHSVFKLGHDKRTKCIMSTELPPTDTIKYYWNEMLFTYNTKCKNHEFNSAQ